MTSFFGGILKSTSVFNRRRRNGVSIYNKEIVPFPLGKFIHLKSPLPEINCRGVFRTCETPVMIELFCEIVNYFDKKAPS